MTPRPTHRVDPAEAAADLAAAHRRLDQLRYATPRDDQHREQLRVMAAVNRRAIEMWTVSLPFDRPDLGRET